MQVCTRWLLFLIIALLLFSCQQAHQTDYEKLYAQKASEVTAYVLKNTPECQCIMEPSRESFVRMAHQDQPEQDTMYIRQEIMQRLQMSRQTALDSMIGLSTTYDLYQAVSDASVKIISRQPLDTIQTARAYLRWIDSYGRQCPDGIYYISKPIFNSDFIRVSFDIDLGGGCLPSYPKVLELREDGWFCEDCGW